MHDCWLLRSQTYAERCTKRYNITCIITTHQKVQLTNCKYIIVTNKCVEKHLALNGHNKGIKERYPLKIVILPPLTRLA